MKKDNLVTFKNAIMIIALLWAAVLMGTYNFRSGVRIIENLSDAELHRRDNCYSNVQKRKPACWNEADWRAICERIECKK